MPSSSSSLSSVTSVTFKATSGTPPNVITHGTQTIDLAGLSLGPNSVEITHPGIKSALSSEISINHFLKLGYGGFSVVEIAGTPYVPPPPPVMKASNGVTNKFTLSSIPSGQPNPYIVQVAGISYAVMSDSQDSKTKIRAYADNFWQPINHSAIVPFVANGTIIPFSRIVTTLMTDMSHLFGSFSTNSLFTSQYTYDDLSTWDVSNVTNMYMMFRRTQYTGFNPNIVNWDVSNVTDMTGMFQSSVFNRNISQWNVTKVTAYSYFTSMSALPKTSIPEKFRDTYG